MLKKIEQIKLDKKKIFVSIVGLVLLIVSGLVLSVGYAKKGVILNPKEQAEIQSVIENFLRAEAKKDIITEEEYRERLKRDSEDSNMDPEFRKIFKDCLETGDYSKCYGGIFRVDSEITLGEMEKLAENKISVKVKEYRIDYYSVGGTSPGIASHTFVLAKQGKKWEIERFENGWEIIGQPDTEEDLKYRVPPPGDFEKVEEIRKRGIKTQEEREYINKMKQEYPLLRKIDFEKPMLKDINFQETKDITITSTYTYNRNNAAWYGWNYALNPNSSFRYFSEGDCTNFISQAVWYGNWPWVGWWPNKYSNAVWWYSFYSWQGESDTWRRASKWFEFTYYRPRGSLFRLSLANRGILQKGDIVQQDTDRNGTMNHSMIVTKKEGNIIKVSYHSPTGNKQDKWLDEILQQNPSSNFYGWLLFNSAN